MEYRVKDKRGEWHMQCDCIVLVTAKVEERTQREFEVKTSYINLFGIDSNQSQRSDYSPSSPRQRKKRQLGG